MRILRFIGIYVLIAAVVAALCLATLWPWHPSSWTGWITYAVLALPVVAVGEWFGDRLLNNPLAVAVDRATARHRFSWRRIGFRVLTVLVLIAVAVFVVTVASPWLR